MSHSDSIIADVRYRLQHLASGETMELIARQARVSAHAVRHIAQGSADGIGIAAICRLGEALGLGQPIWTSPLVTERQREFAEWHDLRVLPRATTDGHCCEYCCLLDDPTCDDAPCTQGHGCVYERQDDAAKEGGTDAS